MKCATQGLGEDFDQAEKSLQEAFLPALFQGAAVTMPDQTITGLTVKNSGLNIPYPTQTTQGKWMASCVVTVYFVMALKDHFKLNCGDHEQILRDGHIYIKRQKYHNAGGGTVGSDQGNFYDGRPQSLLWTENIHAAFVRVFHCQRDRDWSAVMKGCYITPIRHQTSKPVPALKHMWFRLLHIPHP